MDSSALAAMMTDGETEIEVMLSREKADEEEDDEVTVRSEKAEEELDDDAETGDETHGRPTLQEERNDVSD